MVKLDLLSSYSTVHAAEVLVKPSFQRHKTSFEEILFRIIRGGTTCDCLSEWLRRWTRNPLGHARAGSNPAAVDNIFSPSNIFYLFCWDKNLFPSFDTF